MELKDTFIQLVRELKDEKLEDLSKVLLSKGYGLTEDQMKVMSEVFDALKDSKEEKKESKFPNKGGFRFWEEPTICNPIFGSVK